MFIHFFVTYAKIDLYDPTTTQSDVKDRPDLDRWILGELNRLIETVTDSYENFYPERITREVEEFVEYLSNWYVRRSRRRFWRSGVLGDDDKFQDQDKLHAYSTLYETLVTLIKLIAPITPFATESMYQNLSRNFDLGRESVHLEDFPISQKDLIDESLSERTRLSKRIASLGRAARSKAGIKVRQPLGTLFVHTPNKRESEMLPLIQDQILDELNVKEVTSVDNAADIVSFRVQPNFPVLGPKLGKKINDLKNILQETNVEGVLKQIESGGIIKIGEFELDTEDLLISATELDSMSSATESGYAVGISSEISDALKQEGSIRELVHRIQIMRKSAGFEISDHIKLEIGAPREMREVVDEYGEYLKKETLSDVLVTGHTEAIDGEHLDIDGIGINVSVTLLR